ncbi:dynein axonemal heavy chain 5-like [Uloborus diversus]|uniref:dynein axonemal heavy chain 5-like n=1 Tax=Uloborus diversus TaxID=327109 RepID=UPI002409CEEF|nr:dynein axonemal heavy chain 5-like [Uloborus diversus]
MCLPRLYLLTESSYLRKESEAYGPRTELEYWKCRRDTFGFLIYQFQQAESKRILERAFESASELEEETIGKCLSGVIRTLLTINTVSKYYNSTERMTAILTKITNQMINSCKRYISCNGTKSIWEQPEDLIKKKVFSVIRLNEEYQECFQNIKEEIESNGEKEFHFCEVFVFGKFDAFCNRLKKLLKIFECIQVHNNILKYQQDGELLLLDELPYSLEDTITKMRNKEYDFLDHKDIHFDEDFAEVMKVSNEIQKSVTNAFDAEFATIKSTTLSLKFLDKMAILQLPGANMTEKYFQVLRQYKNELEDIQLLFKKQKSNPPISRNYSPVAGKINWCRLLKKRTEAPIIGLRERCTVLDTDFGKKVQNRYKKFHILLEKYETETHHQWCMEVALVSQSLLGNILEEDLDNQDVVINDNERLFVLIREADLLSQMLLEVLPVAQSALYQQQAKLLRRHKELKTIPREELIPLLEIHLAVLDDIRRPGLTVLTWSSLNLDSFLQNYTDAIARVESLFDRLCKILKHRVEETLIQVTEVGLCPLPPENPVPIQAFLESIKSVSKKGGEYLDKRSHAMEDAVKEVIQVFVVESSFKDEEEKSKQQKKKILDASVGLQQQCSKKLLESVITSVCDSLETLLYSTSYNEKAGMENNLLKYPWFRSELHLKDNSLALVPSVDEVQEAINEAASEIVAASKKISLWQFNEPSRNDRRTSRLEGPRKTLSSKSESAGTLFTLYRQVSDKIDLEPQNMTVGCIKLFLAPVKKLLKEESWKWCEAFGSACRGKYYSHMQKCNQEVKGFMQKLTHPFETTEEIKELISVLEEIRQKEVDIDCAITPIEECYATLSIYKLVPNKEDLEIVESLRYLWEKTQKLATETQNTLLDMKTQFQMQLADNISSFTAEFEKFHSDYQEKGPMVVGLSAMEASNRLAEYQNRFDTLWHKYMTYTDGAILFGYKCMEFPRLHYIRRELGMMQKLYKLYNDVLDKVNGYQDILWNNVDVDKITNELIEFQNRCRKLPKGLKEWPAFTTLKKTIDDFNELCPLLDLMTNKAMKSRHWKRLIELTGHDFDVHCPHFCLKDIMKAPLLSHKEDIEDICISALKEKDIEGKLRQVTSEWSNQNLTFATFKNRGELLLRGDTTAEIISLLEDSLMVLGSLQSNRYNAPFKKQIHKWVQDLSNTNECLERWLFTQNMWVYLEAVFVGGDIAKQLPKEAKRFNTIDKSWGKIMMRAHEKSNVVECCVGDDTLKQLLPYLQEQLEICQKSLAGYLEKKRLMFPRFFFVSDPALLEILGQASDSHSIQSHLLSIFDNIKSLIFDDLDYNRITAIVSSEGEMIKLNKPVKAEGNVECWLMNLLRMSHQSLHSVIRKAAISTTSPKFTLMEFLREYPAQIGLLCLQIIWTRESEVALAYSTQDKKVMQQTNDLFLELLNTLIEETTKGLGSVERTKFETFITIHVHQRDIFNDLCRYGVKSAKDFDWMRQFRFYFEADDDQTVIAITDVKFIYQNEFLGCSERLVITPLTDRCYITLAQALHMHMGGAPTGPAGTGKTETVKDMGKTLGKYVVVFNCSDQMDYKGLGRIYKGLAQSGSWGCFDEFNRIELPVLSVAAQQISIILTCKKERKESFIFSDGDVIRMNPEFGLFLTMNPGYAGRQELPENLKIQFRTVAMMVPDRQIIIRVKLASCGFIENITLARKFYTLYKLCEEQLSKQVHYDFGLRNILSVLRTLGAIKCSNFTDSESAIVMRVLKDMNLSKLIDENEPLFLSLLNDLFPGIRDHKKGDTALEDAIEQQVKENGLVSYSAWKVKLLQLYETQLVRHGIVILGPTGAGKSNCIKGLMGALTLMGKQHKEMRMNPKAITTPQMFGRLDVATDDWTDGIFSALWRKTLKMKKGEYVWLVLDGPVDSIWIENLNSVLDDNKTLTLANGDRIPMSPCCKIMFEVHNLENASHATVSRNGMVYMSSSCLPWKPILIAWLNKIPKLLSRAILQLFDRNFEAILNWSMENLVFRMKILPCMIINQMIKLLNGLLPKEEKDLDVLSAILQRSYVFCLMWSIGAFLEITDRIKFQQYLLEYKDYFIDLPVLEDSEDTIFDYNVDSKGEWQHWKLMVEDYMYDPHGGIEYLSVLVPNIDIVRTDFLIHTIAKQGEPVMLLGEPGTAKTVMLKSYTVKLNPETDISKSFNFSSATTPFQFQKTIESYIEKRAGNIYGPAAGKNLTIIIDDINMPFINEWGDQVTNEIVRQTIEMGGFYCLERPGEFIKLADIQYLAAMCQPGGGRNEIPERLKRHFAIFNCCLPADPSIDKIFGSIVCGAICEKQGYSAEVISLAEKLVPLTRKLWHLTKVTMLPTPAKFHYIFNLRELSRIWQGVIATQPSILSDQATLLTLWKHECCRVISDRFINEQDTNWFNKSLTRLASEELGDIFTENNTEDEVCFFVDFLRDTPEVTGEDETEVEMPKIYEPVKSLDALQERLTFLLSLYNEVARTAHLDIVFFKDAISHLTRISRIIRSPGGNALLIGVGGSGKQSLTRLATFIAHYNTQQISLTRNYSAANFLEDLKTLYRATGIHDKGTTFIFTDQALKDECFLEYLNNVLTCGVVSNLFNRDEKADLIAELTPMMKREQPRRPPTPENVMDFFLHRTRKNLHVVLCFSPVGEKLRARALRFPGIVSGCTVDWFQPWPKEALVSVSKHFLRDFDLQCDEMAKNQVINTMADIHELVAEQCAEYYQKFRRPAHVTPKSFLSFINGYKQLYDEQYQEIGNTCTRMENGISKLEEASLQVEKMKETLALMEEHLELASKTAEQVLAEVSVRADAAEVVRDSVEKAKDAAQQIVKEIQVDKAIAEEKLEAARPALEDAEAALNTIQPTHIATVRKLGRPPALIMYIMDSVMILFQKRLQSVQVDPMRKFVKPSWEESLKFMSTTGFLAALQNFPKDTINDEVVELLEPYLSMKDYNMETAKRVCGDVAGLLSWTKSMAFFFGINKEVLPLKHNLAVQEARLAVAMKELKLVEQQLEDKENELKEVKAQYEDAIAEKEKLAEEAAVCRRKMSRASMLITELGGEYKRWTDESKQLKEQIKKLVGDVLVATGFLSYSGPFNQEYRSALMQVWHSEILKRKIPASEKINTMERLVTASTISEWNLCGLPSDELSAQNGVLVTNALRYPLLIDPQAQGKAWLKNSEAKNNLQVTSLNHKYFRQLLEECLSLGKPLLIEDVGEELDPVLENVLEKNYIKSGSTLKVMLGEKECDVLPDFKLFITSKLSNPAFSPEISAKTSVIDFTVTAKGLEDQLLGRVMLSERAELENERVKVISEIVDSKTNIKQLEDNLLDSLTSAQGSLVDNEGLISILQNTKATTHQVSAKLGVAAVTQSKINEAREEFRPVAARGSILYFLIVEMSVINVMYQTSLKQFLGLFDISIIRSLPDTDIKRRIDNISQYLTYEVYRYAVRGLYERHRFLFVLMLALKLQLENGKITYNEFFTFVKGGASLDLNSVLTKPFLWIPDIIWLNIVQLSYIPDFQNLTTEVCANESEWKTWYESEAPESASFPCKYDRKLGDFGILLMVRTWCPDRTLTQAKKFIESSLGSRFVEGVLLDFEGLWRESDNLTPIICLLTTSGDPSNQIELIARKTGTEYSCVSMGQGQEVPARKLLATMTKSGGWVILQNCHLSIDFCHEVLETISEQNEIDENFRLWISTEDHPSFPISLLQISIRFTNESPQGIKASLKRTYAGLPEDILEYSNATQWQPLLFAVAFLNTVVQERRKFGPLGWNVPYEFNQADFTASMKFVQKHLDDMDTKKGPCWRTIRFMLAEVKYGGRVTDDYDRRLLSTYTDEWFNETILQPNFEFHPGYSIPLCGSLKQCLEAIKNIPNDDCPQVFGLHANADITYQINTANEVLDALISVPPQDGGSSGAAKEAVAAKMASEMLEKLPDEYLLHEVKRAIAEMGALEPMNIFLRLEMDRMNKVIQSVRSDLSDLQLAIDGTIIMNDALREAFEAIYHARVPLQWAKISWESSTLGFWFTELLERDQQFRKWCFSGRPTTFWISGLFNPTGFLTAMRQEVTRAHQGWALDSVSQRNKVTSYLNPADVSEPPSEGVYIYGLHLEGASWDIRAGCLKESIPKILFEPLPVLHVYAINSTQGKQPDVYECPVYKKPRRTDETYVTSFDLKTHRHPNHWILRGVSLLADIK